MGQQQDSGRNASLDDKKERAAGRQQEADFGAAAERDDFGQPRPAKGTTGGAFGGEPEGHTKPRGSAEQIGSNLSQGGGGGGAGPAMGAEKISEFRTDEGPAEPESKE